MRPRSRVLLAAWLLLWTAGQVFAAIRLWRFFVGTRHGQRLDWIALAGNSIGKSRIDDLVNTVLNAMSIVSLAVATAVIGFIALMRGRRALALFTIVLIAGANATTQFAKAAIIRPDLGVDPERAAAGNSLPSGHTTIAASVTMALILAVPPKVRPVAALVGAVYTAIAGVATMSAGWHRPSDALAALLIVGAWTAAVGFVLLVVQRRGDTVDREDAHPVVTALLVLAGVACAGVAAYALMRTDGYGSVDPDDLGRRALFTAYAGAAAGIAGGTALLVAVVTATVHRVVPHRA